MYCHQLILICSQAAMDEVRSRKGINIGGTNINKLTYTDDTALLADTEEELQNLVDDLNKACGRYGLKTNIEKTEVMRLTKRSEELPVNISLRRTH